MPVYLKYGTIKGGAAERAHRSWIEVLAAQMGSSRAIGSPFVGGSLGREAKAPSVQEIIVTKVQDKTSPLLFQEAFVGTGVSAIIDFVKDGSVYLRMEMSGAMISSFSVWGGSGPEGPTESLSLNFTGVKFTPTPGTPPP